ncbi:MAG: NiFe hydrogenase [Archaeoglobaceae archaeon]|nr:NiFe hydrogenase [Archaeoglobaceae archaeon]MCX8152416.1 NiFe hydrogenase [Archaeoglobaceae archaeon]MDW8013756.1 NiFe hydrogenase [Archaeoglobaceae archaeon]
MELKLTRRDFLKSMTMVGISAMLINKADILKALAQAKDYWHICWLNGASCSGCEVSFAQNADPDIVEILTSMTVGESGLPIALPDYMQVIHPTSGSLAMEFIEVWKKASEKRKILIVVGSVQNPGFCEIGGKDFRDLLIETSKVADYIIAFGSCSSFGGIPGAKGNVTGAKGVSDFLKEVGIRKTVINLPRCPGHPDSLVSTLASVMVGVIPMLDNYGRPVDFFGMNMHSELCPYRPFYDRGIFITKPGEYPTSGDGCRYKIGCKGPIAYTDCALRKWNNRVSYCLEVGAPCLSCSEKEFPDGDTSPFWKELPGLPLILNAPVEVWGSGLVAAAAAGCAIHFARKKIKKKEE